MASYRVNNYGDDWIELEIYPDPGMPWHHVVCEKVAGPVMYDDWTYGDSTFTVTIDGLYSGADYVIKVAYNNMKNSSSATELEPSYVTTTGGSGGGGETYDYVTMTIRIRNAVSKIRLGYYKPDGGWDTSYAYDGDSFEVQPGTAQQIINVYLDGYSDYGNPIWCEDDTDATNLQVTNENGGLVSESLYTGFSDKTFTFYGTSKYPSVTMTIRITNAISGLGLEYCEPNGTWSTSYARDGDSFDVQPGSTQIITNIDLDGNSGYGNPIWCQGATTFQVTDENGSFVSGGNTLSMGSNDKTFAFYGTSKGTSITLNIRVSSGLSYVRIAYVDPEETGTEKSYQYVYASDPQPVGIQIKKGTDAEVDEYVFSSTDYGHPIKATGASTFNVTTDLGDWNDPVLGNISDGKTFTIKATYGGYNDANSGYVYICTDARNNIWVKATPYICDKLNADGTAHWVKTTPYVKTGSSSTSWTIAGH